MEHALMCPQCNAPLKPQRFARFVVCSFCGATVQLDEASVSTAIFHDAFRIWNSPATYGITSHVSLGDSHWTLERCIAHGEISDVYTGRRARWPTELVILKLLRERREAERFENEWNCLQALRESQARGAATFVTLLPQLVAHGDLQSGQRVSIFRWESGFRHTFEEVQRAYPQGIPPRASIWVWRRILEMLSFVHASGLVHGAVLPPHLLVQEGEHGVRLVGYGRAGRAGGKLADIPDGLEAFYPRPARSKLALTPQLDLMMSARCVAAALGGDPAAASLPDEVPAGLAAVVQRLARSDPSAQPGENAWAIREELGALAEQVFGPPQFIPIVMPS